MNDPLKLLAAGLLFSGANICRAIEPAAPPPPYAATADKPSDGSSLFVGAFGEIIELPYGWTASPTMRGAAEIVYFHRKSFDDFGLKPFHPKPSDYKPENFEALGLLELMVIPKNAPGGFRNLAELRKAKEKELSSSGTEYELAETPLREDWPKGTFYVATSRPYRLLQTFAESEKEFFITTTAGSPDEAAYAKDRQQALNYRYTLEGLDRSLRRHLSSSRAPGDEGGWFVSDENLPPAPSAPNALRIVSATAIPLVAMVWFAFWPKKSPRSAKIRLYGRALILFSLTSALMGFLTAYVPVRSWHMLWRQLEYPLIIASLANLLIAWGAARAFGSRHKRRILLSVTSLVALWSLLWVSHLRQISEASPGDGLFLVPLLLFGLGILAASVFTAAFGPSSPAGEEK